MYQLGVSMLKTAVASKRKILLTDDKQNRCVQASSIFSVFFLLEFGKVSVEKTNDRLGFAVIFI